MIRSRATVRGRRGAVVAPMRLLCSVRDPASALYRDELAAQAVRPDGVTVTWLHTRGAADDGGRAGRIDAAAVREASVPASDRPSCYVCGPTGFVEAASELLVAVGHEPARIRAERFGPSGGRS